MSRLKHKSLTIWLTYWSEFWAKNFFYSFILMITACGDPSSVSLSFSLDEVLRYSNERCPSESLRTQDEKRSECLDDLDLNHLPKIIAPVSVLKNDQILHATEPFEELKWTVIDHLADDKVIMSKRGPSLDLKSLSINSSSLITVNLELSVAEHDERSCESSLVDQRRFTLIDHYENTLSQILLSQSQLSLKQSDFTVWGNEVVSYTRGSALAEGYDVTDSALGPPSFDSKGMSLHKIPSLETLSLGEGGQIIVRLSESISDGIGPDIGIFENSFNGYFRELAYVEVSTDGQHFVRFPSLNFNTSSLGSFEEQQLTTTWGLAGLGLAGTPTVFDLAELEAEPAVIKGDVKLSDINYVRVIDIAGDGSALDSLGHEIYDPYPTMGSSGFDLDAIGARSFDMIDCIP